MNPFPLEPSFICTQCKNVYSFARDELKGTPHCPKCGARFMPDKPDKFFDGYQRFIRAFEHLEKTGFVCNGAEIKWSGYGHYCIYFFRFEHAGCGGKVIAKMEKWKLYAAQPFAFFCPKCGQHPKPQKTVKDFFVALRKVWDWDEQSVGVSWNYFEPLQMHTWELNFPPTGPSTASGSQDEAP